MFKYELHMHTSESSACGKNNIHEMIKKYKAEGYAGAVITNHFFYGNTCIDRTLPPEEFVKQFCAPYFEGLATAKELDFDLLFGIEENLGGGKEFLIYGITPQFLLEHTYLFAPEMNTSPYRFKMLECWVTEAKKCGTLIALAHPFRSRAYIKDPDYLPDSSLYEAVEVYNYCNTPEDNQKAMDFFADSDKIKISGSDLHSIEFSQSSGVLLPRRARDENALVEQLREGNFELLLPKI